MGAAEPRPHPVSGVDYPATLQEFDAWFASEEACMDYLRRLRWRGGFRCACGSEKAWQTARGLLHCAACGRQTSAIAGTVFEGTRKPLRTWFSAMWFVTNQKLGVSALGLQSVLGLGSYQTAWAWLHKLRRAMVRPGRDRLAGRVEVVETYVGGVEPGVSGRETLTKSIVVIAAEARGRRAIGRIRLARVPDVSGSRLLSFLEASLEPGTLVHTDGWNGYSGVSGRGFRHKVTNLNARGEPAHKLMPRVHRVAALLKRWLLGTHQGAVSPRHLDYYLDEFTFRFNRRAARSRGLLFYRLLEQALGVDPVPYRKLVQGREGTPEHNR
jgi:transposase-like protein